jgi:hypothetical protein
MILRLRRCVWQPAACFVLAASALAPSTVLALPGQPGPGGVNVGFDFNWTPTTSPPGATGYTATFINTVSASGATLNTCIGVCNFAVAYTVSGIPEPSVLPGGSYETWTPPGRSIGPGENVLCDNSASSTPKPLTLFDCAE